MAAVHAGVHLLWTELKGALCAAQVELKLAVRNFQTSDILGMSLKEQLAARTAEMAEQRAQHDALVQAHSAATAELHVTQASLANLQQQHEALQQASATKQEELQVGTEAAACRCMHFHPTPTLLLPPRAPPARRRV